MINETGHLKVSFSSFASSKPPEDRWIAWHYRNLDRAFVTLACERGDDGSETWTCIDSSLTRVNTVLYEAFKKGALYEAEIGVRLVRGQKMSAERYLRFVDSIAEQDASKLSTRVLAVAKFPPGSMNAVRVYDQHTWDHSQSVITESTSGITVEIPLSSAEALAFVEVACDRVSVRVQRSSTSISDETKAHSQLQETADMFE